jgi:hypothetical protein
MILSISDCFPALKQSTAMRQMSHSSRAVLDKKTGKRNYRAPELSKIPLDAIDYAARFGNHDDKMERATLYGRRELPYQDFDWQAVRDA